MSEILTVNNFYSDPDRIRELALAFEYWPCTSHPTGGNWPGVRTKYLSEIATDIFDEFTTNIYNFYGWNHSKEVYFETNFQICRERDGESWVHQDIMVQQHTHVFILFLTPNPRPNSGTIFYNRKPDVDENEYKQNDGDPKYYDVKEAFQNVYNRAALYHPHEFHKSDTYFGESFKDSRLTQICFFREEDTSEKFSLPLK